MSRFLLAILTMLMLALPAAAFSGESSAAGGGGSASGAEGCGAEPETGICHTIPSLCEEEFIEGYLPSQHWDLNPMATGWLGYRWTSLNGSTRASEYDYLHDSVAGGFNLHVYPLPWRLDMDFNILNARDHDATLGLAYRDIVKLDYRSMELFHNMDHYRFLNPGFIDKDRQKLFGVTVNDNDISLVVKSPDRPYHIYVDVRDFRKEGTIQQRWQPSFFGDALRSDPRDIQWVTQEVTAGINGNVMGYFEIDYHHTIKAFDPVLRPSLVDQFIVPNRVLTHNLTPKIEDNTNTISVHSAQCLPIVAAGTFTWGDKLNQFSRANVGFHRETGDVTYRPLDNMVLALKYGHQKLDVQNPERVPLVRFPTAPATPFVENNSISSTRDKGAFVVSYYPIPRLLMLAKYEVDVMDRTNANAWSDPEALLITKGSSTTHRGKLTATFTPMRHTKIRGGFTYSHNDNPSYNTDYFNSYEGFVWADWVPKPGLTVNTYYKILRGDNPVRNVATSSEPVDELDRNVERDNAGAGVTWLPVEGVVVGAHYDYHRFKVETNLLFQSGFNFNTPYWDTSHGYTLFANYCGKSIPVELQANFSQNWSRGLFTLQDFFQNADGSTTGVFAHPFDQNTDQKIHETRGSVKADYDIYKGWGTSLSYGVSVFNDEADKKITGNRDGVAQTGTLLLTKKWK